MKHAVALLLSFLILLSCSPATQPSEKEVVNVYASSAAQPWLTELYDCASNLSVVLNVNADTPDIYLRVGEPDDFISHAYQIDDEEILIVTHRESSVQNLIWEEAQMLFSQGNTSAQVLVFSSEAELQILFDQLVMKGRGVTSSARVAANPQEMSDLLNSESNAVGILSRHWVMGNMREVFSVGVVPVLAITKEDPQGVVGELLSCLQSD